jgi:hypothetical protein
MATGTGRSIRGAPSRAPATALAWLLTVALGAPPVAAAPADDEMRRQVEAALEAADRASEAGDHATAAAKYGEVVDLLPEGRDHHDGRALALLDSVRARRRAFTELGDFRQLCAARGLIARYLGETSAAYGLAAASMDGPTAAAREKQDIDAALEAAHATCPGDQVKTPPREDPGPEPPPVAPEPRRSPTTIAGAVTLGVGAGLLVMMAAGLGVGSSAEAAGRDLRREQPTRDIDSLLDADFYRRGRTGNGLAIAGGIVGGALVIVGASLLIVGARKRGRRAVARRLGAAGPALEIRF